MIVIDAGVVVAALAEAAGRGALARERILTASRLHAPHLIDIEVLSAVRGLHRSGKLSTRNAARALQDIVRIPIKRHPHVPLLRRSWVLRNDLSAYDAAYVALAKILDVPLLTADARLARCPSLGCAVELLRD